MGTIRKTKKQPKHARERLRQRAGIGGKREAAAFAKGASRNGLPPERFPKGTEIREYLDSKCHGKRVKVYRGMVVILAKTSDRMITAYPIPPILLEEANRIIGGKEKQ